MVYCNSRTSTARLFSNGGPSELHDAMLELSVFPPNPPGSKDVASSAGKMGIAVHPRPKSRGVPITVQYSTVQCSTFLYRFSCDWCTSPRPLRAAEHLVGSSHGLVFRFFLSTSLEVARQPRPLLYSRFHRDSFPTLLVCVGVPKLVYLL